MAEELPLLLTASLDVDLGAEVLPVFDRPSSDPESLSSLVFSRRNRERAADDLERLCVTLLRPIQISHC